MNLFKGLAPPYIHMQEHMSHRCPLAGRPRCPIDLAATTLDPINLAKNTIIYLEFTKFLHRYSLSHELP